VPVTQCEAVAVGVEDSEHDPVPVRVTERVNVPGDAVVKEREQERME